MDAEHERRALDEVEERLAARFPELDLSLIEAAVRLSYAELAGPVRDFVPLLVERAARDRLSFALEEAPTQPAAPSATS